MLYAIVVKGIVFLTHTQTPRDAYTPETTEGKSKGFVRKRTIGCGTNFTVRVSVKIKPIYKPPRVGGRQQTEKEEVIRLLHTMGISS